MILLFDANEMKFDHNGLGALSDALACTVREQRNGEYELELQYPAGGLRARDLVTRAILLCKPDPYRAPQPFRIYRITKPLSGRMTVYARHISYDLAGVVMSPFGAGSAAEAMAGMEQHAVPPNPFVFWTDKQTAGEFAVDVPTSARALLGGSEGSLLDVYGGEYEFDFYTVRLWTQRGRDSGVTIRYGKNLTDLKQDRNIAGVATGVYPYYHGYDGTLITLPERVAPAPGTYGFSHIVPLDLTSAFDAPPTEDQLRQAAQRYMADNAIGVPAVSLTVAFQPLEQTQEYKHLALLERVNLCDTVTVEYPALGVSATAQCVATVYDALRDRYVSIELGDARSTLADTIAGQQQQIEDLPRSSAFAEAVNQATGLITGNKGGYVALHDANGDGKPDEILIMDTPDLASAQKVWRWNNGGLGYSGTGYNGPYAAAITQDGAIVADFITAGSLNAARVTAGALRSASGNFVLDLDANTIRVQDAAGRALLTFSPGNGLTVHGRIEATRGDIGGFALTDEALEAPGIALDSAYEGGSLRLMYNGQDVGYVGAGNGDRVYISAPNSDGNVILHAAGANIQLSGSGIDLNGSSVRVNGEEIGGGGGSVRAGESYCSGTWEDMPSGTRGATAVAASCADDSGYIIKTRWNGGWQWCIDGSSGLSCSACWIAVD